MVFFFLLILLFETVAVISAQYSSDVMINTHKLKHVPVKDVIIREALSVKQVPEELP